VRTVNDEHELPVATYEYFADRDPLTRAVMDRMLAGVSARKFEHVGEPVGAEVERSSSSTVEDVGLRDVHRAHSHRAFRADEPSPRGRALGGNDARRSGDRWTHPHCGARHQHRRRQDPARAVGGVDRDATLARTLLADLVDRGLDPEQAILFVIDGGKALRRAIKDVFGERALVHRCHRHKERNVTDLLPERDRPVILARIRGAWALSSAELAEQRLELLASELERTWPDAAASLREGIHDTLTLMRLGITGQLSKTLCSTNPCKSMIEIVRHTQRNVKRWPDGDMRTRWTAAGMLVAEQQFRRIIGYRDLAKLVTAIEHHTIAAAPTNHDPHEIAEPVTV